MRSCKIGSDFLEADLLAFALRFTAACCATSIQGNIEQFGAIKQVYGTGGVRTGPRQACRTTLLVKKAVLPHETTPIEKSMKQLSVRS
jgi:hypothetical protein